MKNIGVFLARMQPLHNGHMELIRQALNENDEVLVLIGSSDKLNARNPIPGSYRLEILEDALKEDADIDESRVNIVLLPDLTSEEDNSHDWGFYLYSNIVREIGQHCFTMYYSDGWEIITKWFPGFLLRDSVTLKLIARNNCHEGISATEVRRMIVTDSDTEKFGDSVPKAVSSRKEIIRSFIKVWN